VPGGGGMPCVLYCAAGRFGCASSRHAASMKKDFFVILINREAVEQPLAVRHRQIRLGAAARAVRGIPGTAAAAVAIRKTDLGVEAAIGRIEVAAASPAARGWPRVARPVATG